jgi:hypothetical protein
MSTESFTYRFAIRRPDGELLPRSKVSGMYASIFGKSLFSGDDELKPRTWDTRAEAESALVEIREKAAEIGIGDWLGVIVTQLCTPFTFHDPAEHFAAEVQDWLDQGGAQ